MVILVIKTQACILFNFTLPNNMIALIFTNNFHIIIAQITLFFLPKYRRSRMLKFGSGFFCSCVCGFGCYSL